MDGGEVFNFSISKEPKSIKELLKFSDKNLDEIDYIFFHQANAYILTSIAKKLNINLEKVPLQSLSKYGNTSSASIPLAICDFFDTSLRNNINVILSGFGVGLSFASVSLTLNKDILLKVDKFNIKDKYE